MGQKKWDENSLAETYIRIESIVSNEINQCGELQARSCVWALSVCVRALLRWEKIRCEWKLSSGRRRYSSTGSRIAIAFAFYSKRLHFWQSFLEFLRSLFNVNNCVAINRVRMYAPHCMQLQNSLSSSWYLDIKCHIKIVIILHVWQFDILSCICEWWSDARTIWNSKCLSNSTNILHTLYIPLSLSLCLSLSTMKIAEQSFCIDFYMEFK